MLIKQQTNEDKIFNPGDKVLCSCCDERFIIVSPDDPRVDKGMRDKFEPEPGMIFGILDFMAGIMPMCYTWTN